MMRELHPDIGLAGLCQLLGKSRQAYYEGQKSRSAKISFASIVAELVMEIRNQVGNQKLGARKLLPLVNEQLDKEDLSIGRDQLFDIMDTYGLKIRRRKRRNPRTTDNTHGFKRYPNLVASRRIDHPERVWVSDITYIRVKEKNHFMYLSLITDAYSRKIMGFRLHQDLSVEGPLKALLMAFGNRNYPRHKLIHHSDQGVQYCCHAYVSMLKTSGTAISMASKGSPHENALAERVNGTLKQEYELGKIIESEEKAIAMVAEAVDSYNGKRPHQSLHGQTPNQTHHDDQWNQELKQTLSTPVRTVGNNVNAEQD